MAELLKPMSKEDYKFLGGFSKAIFEVFGKIVSDIDTAIIVLNPFRNVFIWDGLKTLKRLERQLSKINIYVQTTLDDDSQYVVVRYKKINLLFLQTISGFDKERIINHYLLRTDISTFYGDDFEYRRILWEFESGINMKNKHRFHRHSFLNTTEKGVLNTLVLRRKTNSQDEIRNSKISDEKRIKIGPFFNENFHPKKPNEKGDFLTTFHGANEKEIQIFIDTFERISNI